MVTTMNVPPTSSAAMAIAAAESQRPGKNHTHRHQKMARCPEAQAVGSSEPPGGHERRRRRRKTEDRPGKSEQLGVVHQLASESGQKRGRQDVTEAEHAVTDDDAG
jgi:hypothetical protein